MFDKIIFISKFLRNPIRIGAIAPSSRYLARNIVEWPDLKEADVVVEYGPGTGAFTGYIRREISDSCVFFAIEQDRSLARIFRGRHPDEKIHVDTVSNVKEICEGEGVEQVDCIVCGLPWAALSDSMQVQFLDAMMSVLKPGGQFVTFAYLQGLLMPAGQRFKRRLRAYFSDVSTSRTVWLNCPPAFVYQCRR